MFFFGYFYVFLLTIIYTTRLRNAGSNDHHLPSLPPPLYCHNPPPPSRPQRTAMPMKSDKTATTRTGARDADVSRAPCKFSSFFFPFFPTNYSIWLLIEHHHHNYTKTTPKKGQDVCGPAMYTPTTTTTTMSTTNGSGLETQIRLEPLVCFFAFLLFY
jgi:hypothetical protein